MSKIKLFTTTGYVVENYKRHLEDSCCSLCTTPCCRLSSLLCAYRKAKFKDFVKEVRE